MARSTLGQTRPPHRFTHRTLSHDGPEELSQDIHDLLPRQHDRHMLRALGPHQPLELSQRPAEYMGSLVMTLAEVSMDASVLASRSKPRVPR